MFLFLFLFIIIIIIIIINYFILFLKKIAISHRENFANIAKISQCEIFAIIAKFRNVKFSLPPTVLPPDFVSLITVSSEPVLGVLVPLESLESVESKSNQK